MMATSPAELFKGDKNGDHIEREFEECGLMCCTRALGLGHRCGYVAVGPDHPLYGAKWGDDDVLDLEVDGGITYAETDGGITVLGWDAAHCWHRPDPTIMCEERRKWYEEHPELLYIEQNSYTVDAGMAEEETRRLARQIAAMEGVQACTS